MRRATAWFRFICKLQERARGSGRTSRLVRVWVRGHSEQRNGIFTRHVTRLAVHVWRNAQWAVRSRVRFTVIVRVTRDSQNFMSLQRASWTRSPNYPRARAHLCERGAFPPPFSFSLLFFQDITPPQRDLHNCERLFVLVSWPPHTRFRTLSVRSSDPDSYANGWVHRRTTARNWRLTLTGPRFPSLSSLVIYPSLFLIHISTFISFSFHPPPPSLCSQLSLFSFPLSLFLYFSPSMVSHSSLVFPPRTECPSGQSESRVPPWIQRIHAFCGCNFLRNFDDSIRIHSRPCSA